MNREDRILALTVLQKEVTATLKAEKATWTADARPEQRDAGMLGDRVVGTITRTKGRESLKVTDMGALVAWAQAHRPELLSYDPHIADDDRARLLKEVEATGDLPDGVDIVTGDPFASVRPKPDAAQAIADAIGAGAFDWTDVLAIEAPERPGTTTTTKEN